MQIYGAPEGTRGCNRLFFFFFHVPSGASNLYFSHSNFFIFSPFPGHQMFITSRKLYHMKFAIFDVARCQMSATSLTFLFRSSMANMACCIKLTITGKLDFYGNIQRILDADWIWCLVAMVVTIESKVTINGKFYAMRSRLNQGLSYWVFLLTVAGLSS